MSLVHGMTLRHLSIRERLLGVSLLVAMVAGIPATTHAATPPPRVAIIVGPVGEELTPQYIELAEKAAAAATEAGAHVVRAYSPNATPRRVLAAVRGANVVIYFGHGTGFPNPYSAVQRPERVNGWGLQGPHATGTHSDSLQSGALTYYGARWLMRRARPAPGFVMIYSNACYAPGASEGGLPRPHRWEALAHVANYSMPAFEIGASAYYATDFYGGAATLVAQLLDPRPATFGDIFRADPNFHESSLISLSHPLLPGARVWLHRSAYFDGQTDFWYAFAGDPTTRPAGLPLAARGRDGNLPVIGPAAAARGRIARISLSVQLLRGAPLPSVVGVCADRCAMVEVKSATRFVREPTGPMSVATLSAAAWRLITDRAFGGERVPVRIYLDGVPPAEAGLMPLLLSVDAKPPDASLDTPAIESPVDAPDSVPNRRLPSG